LLICISNGCKKDAGAGGLHRKGGAGPIGLMSDFQIQSHVGCRACWIGTRQAIDSHGD